MRLQPGANDLQRIFTVGNEIARIACADLRQAIDMRCGRAFGMAILVIDITQLEGSGGRDNGARKKIQQGTNRPSSIFQHDAFILFHIVNRNDCESGQT